MKKTLDNLTIEEQEVLQEFVDAFGLTPEEALQLAVSEGAISESEGGTVKFAPDGYEELKFYIVNNKSHYYKINKALKKAKKDEMFEEDNFYYGTKISKTDDGYNLDECSTNALGEAPKVIVTSVLYKGRRATFDGAGKAEATNLESTLAPSISFGDQANMLSLGFEKGKSIKDIRASLKKTHGDDIPDKLKVKFRCIVFGLVEVDGEWKRFYLDTPNRFAEEDKTTYEYDKALAGVIIKSKYVSKLTKTKEDDNDNPIIQIVETTEMSKEEFASTKSEIAEATKALRSFMQEQQTSAKKTDTETKAETSTEEDSEKDPFEDA